MSKFHTTFIKHKRVIFFLKDGGKLVDRFIKSERKKKMFYLERYGELPFKKVRTASYYNELMSK